jgi:hypothetical protein
MNLTQKQFFLNRAASKSKFLSVIGRFTHRKQLVILLIG